MKLAQRRVLFSGAPTPVKQVTKENFAASTEEMARHVSESEFVAVSLRRTGSFSAAAWHRPLPVDTAAVAYSKAKWAAEKFQLFQVALCPFSLPSPSALLAHPYNYVLFPRDELKQGLPAYSFSCQSSHLMSMADEGFDFNACVYHGISYVSRAQESMAKTVPRSLRLGRFEDTSGVTHTVADSVFIERIRSRIVSWKYGCKKLKENSKDTLISSLGKIILSGNIYGNRLCTEIDVCSERQVQLALQLLRDFSDDLVPLIVPAKSGGTQAIRVVLADSEEDRVLLEAELLREENDERKQTRGFREVIDLISTSKKPIVSYDSLADFTFIYSKFIGPLPPTVDEFVSSVREVFPNVVDVSHMMNGVGSLRRVYNVPVDIFYPNSAPPDVQFPHQGEMENEGEVHGRNAVKTCHLFMKLSSILKIGLGRAALEDKAASDSALEKYTNVFYAPSSVPRESTDKNVSVWTKIARKVKCSQTIFLWGFRGGLTAEELKSLLGKSHRVFSGGFDVRFMDESCALVVFWKPGSAAAFLDTLNGDAEISGSLREMVSEGLRAAPYAKYKRACGSAILETDLGESLEKALEEPEQAEDDDSEEILWSSESMITGGDDQLGS